MKRSIIFFFLQEAHCGFLQLLQLNKLDDSVYDDCVFMTWIEMNTVTASDVGARGQSRRISRV